jgi:hypothetical protein
MMKWCMSLLVLFLSAWPGRCGEPIFDPDPNHPWNRLRDFFFVRTADDGFTYNREELEPPIQALSRHFLEGPSHEQAISLLDDFLNRRAEGLIRDPLKRAILQRDLWAVFGITAGTGANRWWEFGNQLAMVGIEDTGDEHFGKKKERRELQKRLVKVMRRVALSPKEIASLPDNLLAAAKSGSFAPAYDPDYLERAFLPVDLTHKGGAWVLVGNAGRTDGLAAPAHVQFTNGRSLFLVFVHLPEGREVTEAYLAKLGSGKAEKFPEGTQLALVRRMLLIDCAGNLCVSPVTEEVQFRVFRQLDRVESYELLLSRKDLLVGRHGGLRQVGADEASYYDISTFHGGSPTGTKDLLETKPREKPLAVMDCCVTCHRVQVEDGIRSVSSALASRRKVPDLKTAALDEQVRNTRNWTKKTYSWGLLQGLWETEQ